MGYSKGNMVSVKIFFIVMILFFVSCSTNEVFLSPEIKGDDILIDINKLVDRIPVYYRIFNDGKKIDFFVIRGGNNIKAYLNNCRRCFSSGLGFSYEDGYLRCKTCGVRFSVDELPYGMGSCHPVIIPSRREGNKLIIDLGILRSLIHDIRVQLLTCSHYS